MMNYSQIRSNNFVRNGRSGQPWPEEDPEDVLEIKRLILLKLGRFSFAVCNNKLGISIIQFTLLNNPFSKIVCKFGI